MTAPLTLDFVLDEDYLVARALSAEWKGHDDTIDYLRETAMEMCRVAAKDLARHAEELQFSTTYSGPSPVSQQIVPITEEQRFLLAALEWTAEYEEILEQAHSYKAGVEQEWLSNLDVSLPFMQELTGLPLDGRYAVFIMHPSINQGMYLGGRRIELGWSEEFSNENTYILWHEILYDEYILGTNSRVGHSIIELAADNALRVHLNGGNYEPLHGEVSRRTIRNKIFNNDWQQYVRSSNKNICKFKEEMRQKYKRADRK